MVEEDVEDSVVSPAFCLLRHHRLQGETGQIAEDWWHANPKAFLGYDDPAAAGGGGSAFLFPPLPPPVSAPLSSPALAAW